ncbi:MAG: BPL-N domain-containing protein [Candidatus Hermodarchaeota archaeon]
MRKRRFLIVALILVLLVVVVGIGIQYLYIYFANLNPTQRLKDLRVAYYNGEGAWSVDNIVVPHLVEWMGCEFMTIRGSDIQAGDLDDFDVLIWPGGHYPAFWEEIGQNGKEKIQNFVANGGGYFGICAGAYYACDYMVWMDDPAFPPPNYKVEGDELNLDLFPGVAWGPIFEIAERPEPGYAMTQINITNHTHPITNSLPESLQIIYIGGPYILPYGGADYTVLGTYNVTGDPAIVACNYGTGRVCLIGPHAEIEEHSDRDGWQFFEGYQEPIDKESDWPMLLVIMRWLGKIQI